MKSLESVRGASVSLQTWPHLGHVACLSPRFSSQGAWHPGQIIIILFSSFYWMCESSFESMSMMHSDGSKTFVMPSDEEMNDSMSFT